MMYGIANLSIVPVRKEKSEESEMVTQILFGEHFEITGEDGNWLKVRLAFDLYEGWIDNKLCKIISETSFRSLQSLPQVYTTEITNNVFLSGSHVPLKVTFGSTLPCFDNNSKFFFLEDEEYRFEGSFSIYKGNVRRDNIINIAATFLNTPYLWGGKTPFGIDCSGFVQVIYKVFGISLPRDADQQSAKGTLVSSYLNAMKGDLAFFENNTGKIIHVGIISDIGKIIHCSGRVRFDKLDENGIFNEQLNRYTHKLNIIKNVIG